MTIPQQIIQEMREEFIKEFDDWKTSELHRMSDWWIAKYISLLKSLRAEIPEDEKIGLIVIGFDGATKKGEITENGYDAICEEMQKRGRNQERQVHRTNIDELINLLEK